MPGWWARRLRTLLSWFGERPPKNPVLAEVPGAPRKHGDSAFPRAPQPPALDQSRRPLTSCDAYEPPW